jgi:hypothetical protein
MGGSQGSSFHSQKHWPFQIKSGHGRLVNWLQDMDYRWVWIAASVIARAASCATSRRTADSCSSVAIRDSHPPSSVAITLKHERYFSVTMAFPEPLSQPGVYGFTLQRQYSKNTFMNTA